MTMDERVEAAARELRQIAYLDEDTARRYAKHALLAAFPELHGDKPTHWLAPMEATSAMTAAGSEARWASAIRSADNTFEIYAAMRDAYLGKGDGE